MEIDNIIIINDDKPEQPIVSRRKQKIGKYGRTAERNGLVFLAAIVSYFKLQAILFLIYNGEMDVVDYIFVENFLKSKIF